MRTWALLATVQMVLPCLLTLGQKPVEAADLKPDLSHPGPGPDHLGQVMEQ